MNTIRLCLNNDKFMKQIDQPIMITITENVKDGILEIQFSGDETNSKFYKIICSQGHVLQQGKISGYTQRTCLCVGDLKKGIYTFKLDEVNLKSFNII